jgi:phosphatidylglycerophosphatase A
VSSEPESCSLGKVTARKPGLALFVASVCGLGMIPFAPGTFGSLAGLALVLLPALVRFPPVLLVHSLVAALTAAVGVWSADRAATFWQQKDPQRVVIDEVSGQHLAVVLGAAAPLWRKPVVWEPSVLSWKYLFVGFILFRVFDIWKPFPVRQAESLPGGWGIMTDDWVAGVYAAIGLWIVRAAGL